MLRVLRTQARVLRVLRRSALAVRDLSSMKKLPHGGPARQHTTQAHHRYLPVLVVVEAARRRQMSQHRSRRRHHIHSWSRPKRCQPSRCNKVHRRPFRCICEPINIRRRGPDNLIGRSSSSVWSISNSARSLNAIARAAVNTASTSSCVCPRGRKTSPAGSAPGRQSSSGSRGRKSYNATASSTHRPSQADPRAASNQAAVAAGAGASATAGGASARAGGVAGAGASALGAGAASARAVSQ